MFRFCQLARIASAMSLTMNGRAFFRKYPLLASFELLGRKKPYDAPAVRLYKSISTLALIVKSNAEFALKSRRRLSLSKLGGIIS